MTETKEKMKTAMSDSTKEKPLFFVLKFFFILKYFDCIIFKNINPNPAALKRRKRTHLSRHMAKKNRRNSNSQNL